MNHRLPPAQQEGFFDSIYESFPANQSPEQVRDEVGLIPNHFQRLQLRYPRARNGQRPPNSLQLSTGKVQSIQNSQDTPTNVPLHGQDTKQKNMYKMAILSQQRHFETLNRSSYAPIGNSEESTNIVTSNYIKSTDTNNQDKATIEHMI